MSFLLRESAMADKTTSVPTVEAIANTSRPISPDEKSLECNVDMEANKMGDSVDDIVAGMCQIHQRYAVSKDHD